MLLWQRKGKTQKKKEMDSLTDDDVSFTHTFLDGDGKLRMADGFGKDRPHEDVSSTQTLLNSGDRLWMAESFDQHAH